MTYEKKVTTISEESIETCFMLNDHVCKTALDGDCPRSTCIDSYRTSANKVLRDMGMGDA